MTRITKLTLAAAAIALLFASGATAGGRRTAIVATDDWPMDTVLSFGETTCPDGELIYDPATGAPMCTPGGRTHIRDALYYSCSEGFTAAGTPEPRFTGVIGGSMNANFDASFGGFVWGSWTLVPSASCDKTMLEDPAVFWSGLWWGRRTPMCDDGGRCVWIGHLRYIGWGRGGDLKGLRFRGSETVITYTPPPLPYELLPVLGFCQPGSCPVGPEGHFRGIIRRRQVGSHGG